MDEVSDSLGNARVFPTIDANGGYWSGQGLSWRNSIRFPLRFIKVHKYSVWFEKLPHDIRTRNDYYIIHL